MQGRGTGLFYVLNVLTRREQYLISFIVIAFVAGFAVKQIRENTGAVPLPEEVR